VKSAEKKTSAPGAFATTRWSLIRSGAGSGSTDRETREALAELCQIYWRPIFFFIARRGYPPEDAEDLTQDFFVRILRGNWLQKADPARGRFRSLLLKSLQNFLNDAVDRSNSRKRGGHISFISWDVWIAETPSQNDFSTRHGRRQWYNARFAAFVKNARGKDAGKSSRC
jgi:DNA-directed RNA polymerase specialized sigma24 family protein